MPWVGSKEFAFILAGVNAPEFASAPANFERLARRKIFYNPSPTGDRSLRAYVRQASYGRARLVGDVYGPYAVQPVRDASGRIDCGLTMDNGIRAARGAIEGIPYACVIFPSGPCTPWAFWPYGPNAFYPGSTVRGACYVHITDAVGAFAMENLHIATEFLDLYGIPDSPGAFDEMDCACGVHPSSFTKLKFGWLDPSAVPVIASPTGTASFTLHALAQPAPPGRVSAVRLSSVLSSGYFLVEARLRVDQFESTTPGVSSGLPSEGVVVYWVDESAWPPVHLRTSQALTVGATHTDTSEGVEIKVVSQVPSGFDIRVTRVEPADCDRINGEIAAAQAEIRDLQEELASAPPGQKAALVAQIRALQRRIAVLRQRASQLGCVTLLETLEGVQPQALLAAEVEQLVPHIQGEEAPEVATQEEPE
jgi:hypothetical protein